MTKHIAVAILGGTGFGAGELLRLLVRHESAEVVSVVSSSKAGEPLSTVHSHLAGFYDELRFDAELPIEQLMRAEHRIVFAALPHGKSAETISALLAQPDAESLRVIDLSGDFRLQHLAARARFYPESSDYGDKWEFIYGLTELNRRQIVQARCVANPGCLASACALSVLPLMHPGFHGPIVFDAKTGTSGGGKTLAETMHHPTRHASMTAYKVLEHRHEPEIRETLGDVNGSRIETTFVPHLLPISRGIFATAYLTLPSETSAASLSEKFEAFYGESPFVRLRMKPPELSDVVGTNFCDIAIFARGKQVVAMAALDNLVKGMAGQAIQNMNVMTGLPETFGLWSAGFGPL